MDAQQAAARQRELLEDDGPQLWWWLSFADPRRPKGSQFLGVCIVEGANVWQAAAHAIDLGCNPGGMVRGVPYESGAECLPPTSYRERLLTREECAELGAK